MIFLKIHRRFVKHDGKGVMEALNEMAFGKGLIVRGSSYFVFGLKNNKQNDELSTEALERFIQLRTQLPSSMYFIHSSDLGYNQWTISYNHIVSLLEFVLL